VVLYNEPAGLLLYWTMNNVFSLFKNIVEKKLKLGPLFSKTFKKQTERHAFINIDYFHSLYKKLSIPIWFFVLLFAIGLDRVYNFHFDKTNFLYAVESIMIFFYLDSLLLIKYFTQKNKNKIFFTLIILICLAIAAFMTDYIFHTFILTSAIHVKENIIILLGVLFLLLLIRELLSLNESKWLKYFNSSWPLTKKDDMGYFYQYLFFVVAIIIFVCIYNTGYMYLAAPETFGTNSGNLYIEYIFSSSIQLLLFSLLFYLVVSIYKPKLVAKLALYLFILTYFYSYIYVLDLGIYRAGGFMNDQLLVDRDNSKNLIEIIFLLVIVYLVFKFYEQIYKKAIVLIIFLLIIHAIDLSKFNLKTPSIEKNTNKTELSFSLKDSNILIILLDAFPAWRFEEVLDKHPNLKQRLDGFVWYKNTVSNGTFSMVSFPGMLGGNEHTMDKINNKNYEKLYDGMDAAFRVIPENFKGYDYQFIGTNYASESQWNKLRKEGSDIVSSEKILQDYLGGKEFQYLNKDLLRNSAIFKSAPIVLKQMFYQNDFLTMKNKNDKDYLFATAAASLFRKDTNNKAKKPTIKFLWPAYFDCVSPLFHKECAYVLQTSKTLNFDEQVEWNIVCLLNTLADMFDNMKKGGYYDNTKIILTSDHGSHGNRKIWHNYSIYPLLTVKDFNSRGTLKTSNKAMMNSDTIAIACSGMNTCTDVEPDPRIDNDPNRKRLFNVTEHGNFDILSEPKLPIEYQVEVKGDVYDKSNWKILK